jgi:hypothetical protein
MKYHVRKSSVYPMDLMALCNHNMKNGRGFVPNMLCVSPKEFKALTKDEACKHCQKVFLKKRNIQRKKKGLHPVKTWNE